MCNQYGYSPGSEFDVATPTTCDVEGCGTWLDPQGFALVAEMHYAASESGGVPVSDSATKQTSNCKIKNARTTGVGPDQATGPGAFGLYPSKHPGMVAIDPWALGLLPGRQTNDLLTQYASQITISFSPVPNLPPGFPTTFTLGDILDPKSRVGGEYFNGRYVFDIYGFPSNAAARTASGPRTVTITYPAGLPVNCGGVLGDAILPPSGQS